jgi:hypothetical protein
MKKNPMISLLALSVFLVGTVASCAPAQQPTQDPAVIYTMVAQTVAAQFTQTAQALPPSTATLEPTFTSMPPTETQAPTAGGLPTVDPNTATPALQLATITKTSSVPTLPAPTAARTGDSAYLGYQLVADNKKYKPSEPFHQAWGLVNNGTTTWNTNYCLVYGFGTNPGGVSSLCVDKEVPPGKKYEFYFYFVAPEQEGKYITHWYIKNSANLTFYEVYFAFQVAK